MLPIKKFNKVTMLYHYSDGVTVLEQDRACFSNLNMSKYIRKTNRVIESVTYVPRLKDYVGKQSDLPSFFEEISAIFPELRWVYEVGSLTLSTSKYSGAHITLLFRIMRSVEERPDFVNTFVYLSKFPKLDKHFILLASISISVAEDINKFEIISSYTAGHITLPSERFSLEGYKELLRWGGRKKEIKPYRSNKTYSGDKNDFWLLFNNKSYTMFPPDIKGYSKYLPLYGDLDTLVPKLLIIQKNWDLLLKKEVNK